VVRFWPKSAVGARAAPMVGERGIETAQAFSSRPSPHNDRGGKELASEVVMGRLNLFGMPGAPLLFGWLVAQFWSTGSKNFQCPSETTSTLPSTTLMAVWSSIAYAGPPMPLAHFSASAMVFSGNAG
jgi:hypothetical protein